MTPLDRRVYLTVRINLKLKLPQNKTGDSSRFKSSKYIDLTLRKRIAVNVTSSYTGVGNKFGLKRFKNLLGNTGLVNPTPKNTNTTNMTSIIYRIISNIPKSLIEIENRESLAQQAASSLANNSIDDHKFLEKPNSKLTETTNFVDSSLTQFQHYAKTIAAVDSTLKQDRIQQHMSIRSAVNVIQQNNLNSTTEDLQSFSVPGLLKTVNIVYFFIISISFS